MEYDFGPKHPLKPIRLQRTEALLKAIVQSFEPIDPGLAEPEEILFAHSQDYIEVVQALSAGENVSPEVVFSYGFGSIDTPPFRGMFGAALAYCGGAVRAAEDLLVGENLAFNIGGGLHHAQRSRASGFCVFNDPAISITVLKQRFTKIMYVDIDLHHGDGVQAIFEDDPDVLTFSIHESGKSLYPGTGFVQETGAGGAVVNIPLEAKTTGDTWLWAFNEIFDRSVDWFKPEAIVLQMGCDAHINDPLGHLAVTVQEWLAAVTRVKQTQLPILACGGGGYALENVPRMWSAAVLELSGITVPARAPEEIPTEWGVNAIFDAEPGHRWLGRPQAEKVVEYWNQKLK